MMSTVNYTGLINGNKNPMQLNTTKSPEPTPEYHWAVLLMFIVIAGAIGGNLLVCLAVKKEPKLRNMFNYFLVSLALSDLLTAILVMPFSVIKAFTGGGLNEPAEMCQAWYALDVLFTSSTIMHLTVISIDRYLALHFPLKYGAARRTRHTVFKILLVWILAFCLAGPLFYGTMFVNEGKSHDDLVFKGCGPENPSFIAPAVVISFFLPLLIMGSMYVLTVRTLYKQSRRQERLQLKRVTRRISLYSSATEPAQTTNNDHYQRFSHLWPSFNTGRSSKINSTSKSNQNNLQTKPCSTKTGNTSKTSTNPDKAMSYVSRNRVQTQVTNARHPVLPQRQESDATKASSSDTRSSSVSDENNTMDEDSTPNSSRAGSMKANNSSVKRHSMRPRVHYRRVRSHDKGRKAVKVLGVLFVVFVLCYLPFFLTYTIRGMCAGKCARGISDAMIQAFEWLGYSGSMINPIVYHVFSREFRVVFYRLLRSHHCSRAP